MTVLVTGASGFVGGRLARRLREALPGERLVLWGHGCDDDLVRQGAVWRTVDITDRDAVDVAIAEDRPTKIVHLAALSSVGQAQQAAAETYAANLDGTSAIAAALARHVAGAALVFASTGEVYGAAFRDGIVTEETPPRPMNAYARSKLACEFVLRDTLAPVCPVVALRLLNHTGPGQDERFVVPSFAAQIARIEKGSVPPALSVGNLEAERDFLDVDDVIDAYLKALDLAGSASGFEVFNVASGQPRSIRSILESLAAMSSARFSIEQDPARLRPSDIPRTLCDASAFAARTGWAPSREFGGTLKAVLDWWRAKV